MPNKRSVYPYPLPSTFHFPSPSIFLIASHNTKRVLTTMKEDWKQWTRYLFTRPPCTPPPSPGPTHAHTHTLEQQEGWKPLNLNHQPQRERIKGVRWNERVRVRVSPHINTWRHRKQSKQIILLHLYPLSVWFIHVNSNTYLNHLNPRDVSESKVDK